MIYVFKIAGNLLFYYITYNCSSNMYIGNISLQPHFFSIYYQIVYRKRPTSYIDTCEQYCYHITILVAYL